MREKWRKLLRGPAAKGRIAIVLTKAGIPGFAREVGIDLPAMVAQDSDWRTLGLARSQRLRDWLAAVQPSLLRLLEVRFAEIRFFTVSAMGHSPDGRAGFAPRGAMDPLAWILAKRATFARPLLGRVVGRAREAAAAAAVLGFFVGGPTFALWGWGMH